MSDWKPNLYLTFEKERTQPAIDLVMRIEKDTPKRIIDIGCWPRKQYQSVKIKGGHLKLLGWIILSHDLNKLRKRTMT